MNETTWAAVDHYFSETLIHADAALQAALDASAAAGLPAISVSPSQGKLLHLLARSINAANILEIGTLGGYSTIWLARALPPAGRIVTLEFSPKHAAVARANVDRAGIGPQVDIRTGPALESLQRLADQTHALFDLVFIDADKANNHIYFQWALKLTHRGSLIIVDNVVRDGAVKDAASTDPSIVGTRRCIELMAAEPRVTATAIQTVGGKGYDGFALALVIAD